MYVRYTLAGRYGPIVEPRLWRGTGAQRWIQQRVGTLAPGCVEEAGNGTWLSTASFPPMPGAQVGDAVTCMLRQARRVQPYTWASCSLLALACASYALNATGQP